MATPKQQPQKPATRRAAIVGGNRIPFARSNSAYAQASNQDMLTATLDGLVARFGLQGSRNGRRSTILPGVNGPARWAGPRFLSA